MKGKRGKNERARRVKPAGMPFASFLPEAQVNTEMLSKNSFPAASQRAVPQKIEKHSGNGRSSGSFPPTAPSRLPSGLIAAAYETYSSGDCSGFAPDSLFIPTDGKSAGNRLPGQK